MFWRSERIDKSTIHRINIHYTLSFPHIDGQLARGDLGSGNRWGQVLDYKILIIADDA
jgi:hypothetical protein